MILPRISETRQRSALCWLVSLTFLCAGHLRAAPPFQEFVDPNPNQGNKFGHSVVALSTGNVVITSPYDDAGGTDAGAVYLFNGATGALLSTLRGSSSNDNVGSGGVTALNNGNYVVLSPHWDNGAATDAGAVTWGSGTNGVSGLVSSSNSLVGSTADDSLYGIDVLVLANGNYVVISPYWDNGAVWEAGAVTWGSGSTGVSGVISSGNSLVGSSHNDTIGSDGVTVLTNGNYVVSSSTWNNGDEWYAGAVTWGDGTTGVSGVVSSSNSLIGSKAADRLGLDVRGYPGVTALSNGNYVVAAPSCDIGATTDAGAVTWGSGTSGVNGVVNSSNSLVGSRNSDQVGFDGVTVLSNGNYVVGSEWWANGTASGAGAATWGSGTAGVKGVVGSTNSLIGSKAGDGVGVYVVPLTNGNYVVGSSGWDNGAKTNAGAVTWGDGATGVTGGVSGGNSLIGSVASDFVGSSVTALSNGNYVVVSIYWNRGAVIDAGAATLCSGTTGLTGLVSTSNSLVGTKASDYVGSGGVHALSNGNYVVLSPSWDNAAVANAGAVTWGSGTGGVSGLLSSSNSLIGSAANDQVGFDELVDVGNSNYVVCNPRWNNGSVIDAGAVTWGSGTVGVSGVLSSSNSLVGSHSNDQLGGYLTYPVKVLSNGNYVVLNPLWDNGAAVDAGAASWGDGNSGVSGVVGGSNSIIGSKSYDGVGAYGLVMLGSGNYVVISHINTDGAVTWGSGSTGTTGEVSAANSLVGGFDHGVGNGGVLALANGNYVVLSPLWDNVTTVSAGAVTWCSGASGGIGPVNSANSIVGLSQSADLQPAVIDNVNGTYLARFLNEGPGKVRLGAQDDGLVPNVLAVASAAGGQGGGNSVTITGRGFTGAAVVSFGGSPADGVTILNYTTLIATVPAHAPGTVDVAVTTSYGTGTGSGLYTYSGPEMEVIGNSNSIPAGDNTPSIQDHTNFGAVLLAGGTLMRSFIIHK
jgi:hypothetical protein